METPSCGQVGVNVQKPDLAFTMRTFSLLFWFYFFPSSNLYFISEYRTQITLLLLTSNMHNSLGNWEYIIDFELHDERDVDDAT